jgi:hypothetical protein
VSTLDIDRRPMRLTAAQWDRVGHSRRGLLYYGPPISGRVSGGQAATILGCEFALAGVRIEYARELVVEGMPFSVDSTPAHDVRRRTMTTFFENGWRIGQEGHGLGCVCTNPHNGFAAILRPYCAGSCFAARQLDGWQAAVLRTLPSAALRDVWTFLCRRAGRGGVFCCSLTYVARGLGYVHGFSTVRAAFVHLGKLGLVERSPGVHPTVNVPLRRVVRPVGIGQVDDELLGRGRVEASGHRVVWCAPGLGADARDVYGLAAVGVDTADDAVQLLPWSASRRRVAALAGRLRRAGLLEGRTTWKVRGEPSHDVLAEAQRVYDYRRNIVSDAVERGRERDLRARATQRWERALAA